MCLCGHYFPNWEKQHGKVGGPKYLVVLLVDSSWTKKLLEFDKGTVCTLTGILMEYSAIGIFVAKFGPGLLQQLP